MKIKRILLMLITVMIAWDLSLHVMETFNLANNFIYHAFVGFLSIVSYNAFWTTYWGIALIICLCILEPWKRLTTITKIVKRKKVKLTSSLLLFLLLFTTLSSLIVVMPVSEADGNPPAGLSGIYVFFAGWKGERGSPYWYPDSTDCDNGHILHNDPESYPGYAVADMASSKDWFYFIGYAYDAADGVDKFWLNWLDAATNTWYNDTYFCNPGAVARYYWNSSGNFTFIAGHKYSFDVWVNDTVGNAKQIPWNKKDPSGATVRRYIYMNCPTSADPAKQPYGRPLYLHTWPYQYVYADEDRFYHDQGNDLGKNDTGWGTFEEPTAEIEQRNCGSYMGWWYAENLTYGSTIYGFENFTAERIYYRAYVAANVSPFKIGWAFTDSYLDGTFNESKDVTFSDGITTIYYDDSIAATNNTYKLYTGLVDIDPDERITENNVWEIQFKVYSNTGYPSVISNESMRSFFWLLPDNATLNTSYVDIDKDGISTYDELFVYNTDPNTPDSDHDGVSDYKELFITGSDPNNYTSTFWNWSSDPYWNYEKPRVSLPTITSTSFENVTVNTTLEFGYNCTCGYWIGQSWPINAGNLDSNVTCISGEYNHYDNQYFTYTFTSLGTGEYYVVPWASNPNGFIVFNNFSGCIADHWGYRFNGSGWYNDFTFARNPYFSRTSLVDNNTVEWFLKFAGIHPFTDWVFRDNGALKSWARERDPAFNSLTVIDNSTDEPDYWYDFLINDTNINMTFEYSNSSTQYYFIQWPEAIWESNTSIAANDTILNFNQQAGIYDDIYYVFMEDTNTGSLYSWARDISPVYWTMTNYYSKEEKPNYHYFLYSSNLTNFTIFFDTGGGFDFETGTLGLNCFNESNPTQAIGFDILISNEDGTQTYEATDLNNTCWLNFSEIPFGENTIFVVSNESYKQRIYYYDIILGNTYNLTFYLPPNSIPSEGGGGEEDYELRAYSDIISVSDPDSDISIPLTFTIDSIIGVYVYNSSLYVGWVDVPSDKYSVNSTHATINESVLDANSTMAKITYYYRFYTGTTIAPHLYIIQINDEFSNPIDNVKIAIDRYINTTDSYQQVSSLFTDANGEIEVYLIPSALYRLTITKTGYESAIEWYIPDPEFYGIYYPKTFKLIKSAPSDYTLWTNIEWNIDPTIFDHYTNITFYFNISSTDDMLEWYNMTIAVYNETTGEYNIIDTQNITDDLDGGSLTYTTTNATNKYALYCSFKKEDFAPFFFGMPHSNNKYVYTIWELAAAIGGGFDYYMNHTLGASPVYVGDVVIAYSSLAVLFVITFLLFIFAPKFAGFGIMFVGLVVAAFKNPLNFIPDHIIGWETVVGIIIIGFLTILYMRKKG